jgi:hypothetical protein
VFGFPTGSSTKLYRISGFNFNPASDFMVWTCPAGGCSGTISQFRMDHNSFALGAEAHSIVLGENTSTQYVQGVIDHNTFTGSSSHEPLYFLGAQDPSPLANPQGTSKNMFFEDNTITVTTMTNAGLGAVDGWGAGSNLVFRYNTVTNSLVTAHELGHNGGFQNFEIYNNHVIANSSSTYPNGYRLIHHQGSGTGMYFNNTLTAVGTMDSSAISITAKLCGLMWNRLSLLSSNGTRFCYR